MTIMIRIRLAVAFLLGHGRRKAVPTIHPPVKSWHDIVEIAEGLIGSG